MARTTPTHANIRLLPKEEFPRFFDRLVEFGQVYAPVRKTNGTFVFDQVSDCSEVALDYVRTALPPKKVLYPCEQILYRFSPSRGFVALPEPENRQILFGVHPCDVFSFSLLDLVFAGDYPEPRYFKRRARTSVVGLSCMPDEKCFCRSMGTDCVERGFDLFLTDIGEDYFVRVGTGWGEEVAGTQEGLFRAVSPGAMKEYKKVSLARTAAFVASVEMSDMPQIMEIEYNNRLWEELGEKCLSCGSCSMVCPTCYCYDIYDQFDLAGDSGSRYRRWDSCLFKEFAQVAGFNFRAERSTRIKLRYYHKQVAFVEEYGRTSCVGCGRCIDACPAGINIVDVLNQIRGEKVVSHAV